MKSKTKTIIALVGAALAVVILATYFASANRETTSATRIALNIPLTGPIASFSGQYANGLRMGIEDASAELGIPADSFQMDSQDNQGSPATAATIAQRQVISGFDAYISGVSQMSTAAAPIVDDVANVHLVIAYDARLVEQSDNRMRLLPHSKIQGPVYPAYAIQRGAKRVFAFVLNNPELQQEYREFAEPGLREAGIETALETFEFNHSDYRTLVQKAKAFQPDLIIVSGFSLHVLPIIQALKAEAMVNDGNVISIMDFNELLGTQEANKALAGVAYIVPSFDFPENRATRDEWSARFKARFGAVPNFVPAYAYDTGRLIVMAKNRAGTLDKKSLTAQLPNEGITGKITVDKYGDLSTPLGVLQVMEDGSLKRTK